jgi:hypothetical protein
MGSVPAVDEKVSMFVNCVCASDWQCVLSIIAIEVEVADVVNDDDDVGGCSDRVYDH